MKALLHELHEIKEQLWKGWREDTCDSSGGGTKSEQTWRPMAQEWNCQTEATGAAVGQP